MYTRHASTTVLRSLQWSLKRSVPVQSGGQVTTRPLDQPRFTSIDAPLKTNPANHRYFIDGSGKAIYLSGASTLASLQDSGSSDPPPVFDYLAYLDLLRKHNHNFFRLYRHESPRWNLEKDDDNYWYAPMPYRRTGPGDAQDTKPKFNLAQLDDEYFDRLRQRVEQAQARGIYVSVMLFNGFSVADHKGSAGNGRNNPWRSHPFHRANNINGIDGDPGRRESGEATHTLAVPEVTALQEAYVRRVIDTVNEFNNVLYEISNESRGDSRDWQYHLIAYVKNYEKSKRKQHPVGMVSQFPDGDIAMLLRSPADWISPPSHLLNPPVADGGKVVINDTDHICGFCGDPAWVWKSFTRGNNTAFLDPYDYLTASRSFDPQWDPIRRNLGYALTYTRRMNLSAMRPRPDVSSTGYCLASPGPEPAEYLVYAPHYTGRFDRYLNARTITVDLSGTTGELSVEWLDPCTGLSTDGIKTTGGGNRSFVAPFDGDAVLYIRGT
jgi:hypothetical protein